MPPAWLPVVAVVVQSAVLSVWPEMLVPRITQVMNPQETPGCAVVVPVTSAYAPVDPAEYDVSSAVSAPRAARYTALEQAIRAAHPYELPEIVAVPIERGLPAYLDWVAAETAPQP